MLKGCVQVGSRPKIDNTVNMVPVNHVARLVAAAAFNPPTAAPGVCHVTSHPRLTFDSYLELLETYGYNVPCVPYSTWQTSIEEYVDAGSSTNKEELAL